MFRVLYWIPDASVASAIIPPAASISLTRCVFPKPPIAGLQDIWPMELFDMLIRQVLSFFLCAAWAASHPACPPPITITSYLSIIYFLLKFKLAELTQYLAPVSVGPSSNTWPK